MAATGERITLAAWVYKMVQEKKTDTAEFKIVMSVYGREKLLRVYQQERARREKEQK